MNNYMKTIISGLKQWVSSQKSDWNQNDSSSANYIKNRTHYVDKKEIIEVPQTTFTTADMGGVYGVILDITTYPKISTDGEIRTVVFDGINYECSSVFLSSDGFFLGNGELLGRPSTGEPFAYIYDKNNGSAVATTDTEPTEHTIEIKYIKETIHKLDKKYLPDDLVPEEILIQGDSISNLYNDSVVSYSEAQTLTDNQKARARVNIGAGTSNFNGNYNYLTNKPNVLLYDQSQSLSNSNLIKVYQNLKLNDNFLRLEQDTPIQILTEQQQKTTKAKIGIKDSPAYNVVNSEGIILNPSQLMGTVHREDNLTKILHFFTTYIISMPLPTENNKYLISVNGLRRSTDPTRFESRVFQGTCKRLDDTTLYIGNLALRDVYANNSGEEFLWFMPSEDSCSFFLETEKVESWSTGSIYLSIFDNSKIKYHTLDKRYLPTDILTSELINDSLVTYSKSQMLSNEQKIQARNNIGAGTSNFSGSYNDLTNKPETQIINDIFSLDELTNPNVGIIYRSSSGSEAGFLNILDAAPIKEDSMPKLLICNNYGAESGTITYHAKSDVIGTETLTINFNDNTVTGVNIWGTVSTNTLDDYYTDTGYGDLRMIRVEELWTAHCILDFYTSAYKAVSSDINNVYEGIISPIATKAYIDTKEFNYATEEDIDYILTTLGLKESLNLITTTDGKVLTDNNGVIYTL